MGDRFTADSRPVPLKVTYASVLFGVRGAVIDFRVCFARLGRGQTRALARLWTARTAAGFARIAA